MTHDTPDTTGMPEVEYITHESLDEHAWVCTCGNTPSSSGFVAYSRGAAVEPTPESWNGVTMICVECGRIIDQDTLEVLGRRGSLATAEGRHEFSRD